MDTGPLGEIVQIPADRRLDVAFRQLHLKPGAFGHAAHPPTKYEAAFGHGARRTSGHRFPSAVCEAGLWRRSRLRASKSQWDHRKQAFVVQIQRSGAFIQLHWQRS
jgi:hypothetical protein